MTDWFVTLDESLWLKPDEVGEAEAAFLQKALRLRKGHRVLDARGGLPFISRKQVALSRVLICGRVSFGALAPGSARKE